MRPSTSLLQLAVCLSSLAPLASAWPSWMPELDSLVVRQDDGDSPSSTAAETGSSATESSARETGTSRPDDDEDEDGGGDLNTAEPTGRETGTRTGGSKETDKPKKTKSIPPDAAVGGVNIMTPVTTAIPTVLFKIGDNITLGWNYTALEVEPTAVDVLLSCSPASETWTLTSNMTFQTDVSYIWDSREQADDVESPLLTEMYTLIVKDSEAEISEFPSPGKLGANQDFKFGLYKPQPYTPWPDWECTGCSGATSNFDTQVVKLAFTMCFITVFTFTWFVTGWGVH
ncbi:hypothetical protein ACRE_050510 [Hapsidospora chrysogenum ATCC 11550]|uniref:DUF7137 domain-containing protein n=1 Tax=Hapsidospora chrysogenum (strain ATCC 11550 / CBS 779.69 / DSM 880 / IAM 14645 / JCM 23072 / IMI 49137) TaxID=857340 RepID=A0A086T494_HAPC1|nr:hypothetical protein ACRE_050510 [Hapsidospora chrysogenum ATCC 11550]